MLKPKDLPPSRGTQSGIFQCSLLSCRTIQLTAFSTIPITPFIADFIPCLIVSNVLTQYSLVNITRTLVLNQLLILAQTCLKLIPILFKTLSITAPSSLNQLITPSIKPTIVPMTVSHRPTKKSLTPPKICLIASHIPWKSKVTRETMNLIAPPTISTAPVTISMIPLIAAMIAFTAPAMGPVASPKMTPPIASMTLTIVLSTPEDLNISQIFLSGASRFLTASHSFCQTAFSFSSLGAMFKLKKFLKAWVTPSQLRLRNRATAANAAMTAAPAPRLPRPPSLRPVFRTLKSLPTLPSEASNLPRLSAFKVLKTLTIAAPQVFRCFATKIPAIARVIPLIRPPHLAKNASTFL